LLRQLQEEMEMLKKQLENGGVIDGDDGKFTDLL
jgi:hypothetical protein